MFEGMTKFEMSKELGKKFLGISGVWENGFEWNLMEYISDYTVYKKMVKVYTPFLTSEMMKQLLEVFEGCELRIEPKGEKILLVIRWD